jgi:DNA-binding NtrC family response regulator
MLYRVLLVDDDPNLLDALRRALRKDPFQILTAPSGAEALSILEDEHIDVVVSDQDMPGMSGTEFLSQVQEKFSETIRFMLTGNATLETAIDAINKGAITRFFTKPCNPVDLAVTIRQVTDHKVLLDRTKRLLQTSRRQSSVIEQLERRFPGITAVDKDKQGAVILDLPFHELIEAITDQVENGAPPLVRRDGIAGSVDTDANTRRVQHSGE